LIWARAVVGLREFLVLLWLYRRRRRNMTLTMRMAAVAANRSNSSSDGNNTTSLNNNSSSGSTTPQQQQQQQQHRQQQRRRSHTPPPTYLHQQQQQQQQQHQPNAAAGRSTSFASIERALSTNSLVQLAAAVAQQTQGTTTNNPQHRSSITSQHRGSITSRCSRISSLTRDSSSRSIDPLKIDISDLTSLFGRQREQQQLQKAFVQVLQRKPIPSQKANTGALPKAAAATATSASATATVVAAPSATTSSTMGATSTVDSEEVTAVATAGTSTTAATTATETPAEPPGPRHTREVVLVHGRAGSGKSALVLDFRDAVTSSGAGYFCRGTFSQYQATPEPYSGILEAFSDLWTTLVDRGRRDRETLKVTIQRELGDDVRQLARGCPKLKTLLKSTNPHSSSSPGAPPRYSAISTGAVIGVMSSASTASASAMISADTLLNGPSEEFTVAAAAAAVESTVSAPSSSASQQKLSNPQRLCALFHKLLLLVCDPSHPVVLFLDDLQWADAASVHYISTLLGSLESESFLFIGAYRDHNEDDNPINCPLPGIPTISTSTNATNSNNVSTSHRQGSNRSVNGSNRSVNGSNRSVNGSNRSVNGNEISYSVTGIELKNLELESVDDILCDLTGQRGEAVTELAKSVLAKTYGNPLSIMQFLEMLQLKELLTFSFQTHKWVWDIELIKSKTDVAQNVGHSLANQIARLPNESKKVLSLAACMGMGFDSRVLEKLALHLNLLEEEMQEHKLSIVKGALREAISGGLIHPDQIHQMQEVMARQILQGEDDRSESSLRKAFYEEAVETVLQEAEIDGLLGRSQTGSKFRFSHELVQESLYALTEGKDRELLHLGIGQVMRAFHAAREEDETLFAATDHMNRGADHLIGNRLQRMELVSLNLKASQKAKDKSTTGFLAADFIAKGLALLQLPQDWKDDYPLVLELYRTAAELEFSSGRFDLCHSRCQEIKRHAVSTLDKLGAIYIEAQLLYSRRKLIEAIQLCRSTLVEHLNECIPSRYNISAELRRTKRCVRGASDGSFMAMTRLTDELIVQRMRFLNVLAILAHHTMNYPLFALAVLRIVRQSVEHGLCDFAPLAFASYGVLLSAAGNRKEGFRFGNLALKLCDRLDHQAESSVSLPGTYMIVFTMLDHMKNPLLNGVEPLLNGYRIGMANGDFEYASLCISASAAIGFACALPLRTYAEDLKNACAQLKALQQDTIWFQVVPFWQCALNLAGSSEDPTILTGEAMDEEEFLGSNSGSGENKTACLVYFYLIRYWVAFLFNDYELARQMKKELDKRTASGLTKSHFLFYMEILFSGLLSVARFRETKKRKRKVEAKQRLKELQKHVKAGMENWSGCYLLLHAEVLGLEGRAELAKRAYDEAMKAFANSGFIHLQALASEKAADYMLQQGRKTWSDAYIRAAFGLYTEWGALSKAEHLMKRHKPPTRVAKVDEAPPVVTVVGRRPSRFIPIEGHIEEENPSADFGSSSLAIGRP
jgi:predicted ATPase